MASTRKVLCPHCGKYSEYSPDNPWRPFCCERCKMIDLGLWANEGYRIAQAPQSTLEDEHD